jgi:hypothetical protein
MIHGLEINADDVRQRSARESGTDCYLCEEELCGVIQPSYPVWSVRDRAEDHPGAVEEGSESGRHLVADHNKRMSRPDLREGKVEEQVDGESVSIQEEVRNASRGSFLALSSCLHIPHPKRIRFPIP